MIISRVAELGADLSEEKQEGDSWGGRRCDLTDAEGGEGSERRWREAARRVQRRRWWWADAHWSPSGEKMGAPRPTGEGLHGTNQTDQQTSLGVPLDGLLQIELFSFFALFCFLDQKNRNGTLRPVIRNRDRWAKPSLDLFLEPPVWSGEGDIWVRGDPVRYRSVCHC